MAEVRQEENKIFWDNIFEHFKPCLSVKVSLLKFLINNNSDAENECLEIIILIAYYSSPVEMQRSSF